MATLAEKTFYIKEGDRLPNLDATLVDADGIPVDLTDALVVKFKMRRLSTLVIDRSCSVTDQSLSANHGKVRYVWQAGDTATPGQYKAEFEVTWADGKAQTFPSGKVYARVVITKDLDA